MKKSMVKITLENTLSNEEFEEMISGLYSFFCNYDVDIINIEQKHVKSRDSLDDYQELYSDAEEDY